MSRKSAPAALRNREPILAVLRRVLPRAGRVLEIASGSGEHALYFAGALPKLTWQPSDPDAAARDSIADWASEASGANLLPPLDLDVTRPGWQAGVAAPVDAILCCNMIHIAPWAACLGLLDGARDLLGADRPLVLYGPFQRGGAHTAPSNAAFDASLRERNPAWGVRDLDVVEAEARSRGLALKCVIEMPANNLSVVFRTAA